MKDLKALSSRAGEATRADTPGLVGVPGVELDGVDGILKDAQKILKQVTDGDSSVVHLNGHVFVFL